MAEIAGRLAVSRLTIDLGALAANWRLLQEFGPRAEIAAVVKADAYGLGAARVAPALAGAGCRTFFCAFPEEALTVRAAVPDARVFVLAGLDAGNGGAYLEHRLIPVVNCERDLATWQGLAARTGRRLACALNFDTGMNRLGFGPEEAARVAGTVAEDGGVEPALVMSHLACADQPRHPKNDGQKTRFDAVRAQFPGVPASFASSAALLSEPAYAYDLARPGIALYGGGALTADNGAAIAGPVMPVVTFEARIAQVRAARAGETVGYGATATLARDSRIAIACAGYADGYLRAASGSAEKPGALAAIAGFAVPVLGRVSMDLAAFDVTDLPDEVLEAAEWIELIGETADLDDFARAAGTIGYEVLTRLGARAERVYLRN